MVIAGVIAFCILILILAFVVPKLSRHPERGGQKVIGAPTKATRHAPGKLGTWLSKPFGQGQRAVGKSGSAGRRGRDKMPL